MPNAQSQLVLTMFAPPGAPVLPLVSPRSWPNNGIYRLRSHKAGPGHGNVTRQPGHTSGSLRGPA